MKLRRRISHRSSLCRCSLLGGAVLAAAVSAPLHAQQTSQTPAVPAVGTPESPTPQTQLDEIVVTAEKRAETLQSVPLAITALSGAALENSGAASFEDIALSAPSVSFVTMGPAQDKVVMRGITSGLGFDAQAPATGYYIDDTPVSLGFSSGGTDLTLFDIDHVEVLRGPQGTLYGGGAMGGAIRVITNKPDLTSFGGEVEATGADIADRAGQYAVNSVLNAPLINDQLAVRLVETYTQQGGWIDNVEQNRDGVNSSTKAGGRAELLWQPTADFSAKLSGSYQHTTAQGLPTEDLSPGKKPLYGDLTELLYVSEAQSATTAVANLALNYSLPWATIESSTSYFHEQTLRPSDGTLGNGVLLPAALHLPPELYLTAPDDGGHSYVEELRLVSASSHPFKWVVGAYYQRDDIIINRSDTFLPGQTLSASPVIVYLTTTTRDTKALFAEGTYDLTDHWHLTAGARGTTAPTTFDTTVYGLAFGEKYSTASKAIIASGSQSSNDFSPKLELTYTPIEQLLFYTEVAKGFRPGSPNPVLPPTIQGVPAELKPDRLWDYELGAKTQWLDGRLVANGDIYYITWNDMQVTTSTPASATQPAFPYLGNAGDAISKGAEFELDARLSPAWRVSLSGNYDDAYFTQYNSDLKVSPGERIASVPKLSGSVATDYSVPINNAVTGFAHLDVRYEDAKTVGYTSILQGIETSPYAIADLRFGADLPGQTRVTAFVDNITDNRAQLAISASDYCASLSSCTAFNPNVAAKLRAYLAQPRTFGITVSKRF
jgi:outer membrane receptor protein involved in Fe transport